MNKQKNILTLNQNLSIHLPKATHETRKERNVKLYLQVLMVDLSRLGFKLERSLLSTLKTYSAKELKAVHKFLTTQLSEISGDHVDHIPLFKNFPEDVPDKDAYNMSRFIGFFQNYLLDQDEIPGKALSCGHKIDSELFSIEDFGACPICQMKVTELHNKDNNRPDLTEKVTYKKIKALTVEAQDQYIHNLFNYSRPYSPKQRKDLDTFITSVGVPALQYLPKSPKIKENFTYLAFQVYKLNPSLISPEIKSWFKTATDVLRLVAQISGSLNAPKIRSLEQTFGKEASLASDFKIKLPNQARKLVLELLESTNDPIEDMMKYRNLWLAVGKYLHVGTYKDLKNVNKAFDLLRNHKDLKTYSQKVHGLLSSDKKKDISEATNLLVKRPGLYLRNLDQLLRKASVTSNVVENLPLVLDQVPLAMLLKLNSHFSKRNFKSSIRYFIPKGEVSKLYVIDKDTRPVLDPHVVSVVKDLIQKELVSRFKDTKALAGAKNVYIDPKLKDVLVPLNIQSSTKSMNTVQRGSKLDIPMGKTLRLFCYWKQNDSRIDVDLSMVSFDSKLNFLNQVSWTNLSDSGVVHSGDIQSAPEGASEFIDISTDVLLKSGVRYVGVSVNSFTGQKFNTFQSFAGVMVRNSPKSGEVYEPSTVEHKYDLSTDSTVNIPFLLDLKTGQLIWVDVSGDEKTSRMVSPKQINRVIQAAKAMSDNSPNMYELLSLHAKASKAQVNKLENIKDYDQVFTVDSALDVVNVISRYVK